MDKPFRRAVALVIRDHEGRVLIVRRPDDPQDDIAGIWGFPAVSTTGDETAEELGLAVAREKLGIEIRLGRRIGASTHERREFVLELTDFEAVIVGGTPRVPQADKGITQYVDCRFTADPLTVVPAAREGSQCSQLFLEDLGIDWRDATADSSARVPRG